MARLNGATVYLHRWGQISVCPRINPYTYVYATARTDIQHTHAHIQHTHIHTHTHTHTHGGGVIYTHTRVCTSDTLTHTYIILTTHILIHTHNTYSYISTMTHIVVRFPWLSIESATFSVHDCGHNSATLYLGVFIPVNLESYIFGFTYDPSSKNVYDNSESFLSFPCSNLASLNGREWKFTSNFCGSQFMHRWGSFHFVSGNTHAQPILWSMHSSKSESNHHTYVVDFITHVQGVITFGSWNGFTTSTWTSSDAYPYNYSTKGVHYPLPYS